MCDVVIGFGDVAGGVVALNFLQEIASEIEAQLRVISGVAARGLRVISDSAMGYSSLGRYEAVSTL
jgi:hypothetical protein